ncbi:MAG TPA: GNAT family N-acetyltransferase [Acetobacteraceae bacterium]|nr:GNAT family N-acetyltransferase [Acetobacteraceae bacterium]
MTEAGPLHAAALAVVHEAAFPPEEVWDEAAFAGLLGQPGIFGLLDRRGGLVLARVVLDEAEILTLAVVPSARRRGLGRALLAAALARARERGATAIFLEVAAGNAAARMLYTTAGFEPVGLRRGYYADGADALVLRRALAPAPHESEQQEPEQQAPEQRLG